MPNFEKIQTPQTGENPSTSQSDLKISASLIVSNINDRLAKRKGAPDFDEFLDAHERMLREDFDTLTFDYYPGLWHQPLKEAGWSYKDTFKQLGDLRRAFERAAAWGKDYEIGEVGTPSNFRNGRSQGEPKSILRGRLHAAPAKEGESQLKRVLRYTRRPIEKLKAAPSEKKPGIP